MHNAKYWINHLQMERHPEGGWFREIYRSTENVPVSALPNRFKGNRSFGTSIYFLLEGKEYSAFHRIKSDEIWHFYSGSCLSIFQINASGDLVKHKLGNQPEKGEKLQLVIDKETWFASRLENQDNISFALVGCTVSPGFDFEDFEMAKKSQLLASYPQHKEIISELSIRN